MCSVCKSYGVYKACRHIRPYYSAIFQIFGLATLNHLLPGIMDTLVRKTDTSLLDIMHEENLHTAISERRVQSRFGKRLDNFLPRGHLDDLVKRKSILKAMKIPEDEVEEEEEVVVAFILERAKKLFTILVTIRHSRLFDAISLFKKRKFDDSNLPIEVWTAAKFTESQHSGVQHPFFEMQGVMKQRDIIWDKSFIYDFQDKQWEFLAPLISTEETNNRYGSNVIMPFIVQHASYAEGSFGVVSKYEIHEDHIVITDTNDNKIRPVC